MGLIEKLKNFPKIALLSALVSSVSIGCVSKTEVKPVQDAEGRVYCTEEQRKVEVCIEIYQPVCGYPEKKTYSNPCFACMDKNVEYWVDGPCSE